MHAEEPEAAELFRQFDREPAALEPLCDIRKHVVCHPPLHEAADLSLLVGKEPVDLERVPRVDRHGAEEPTRAFTAAACARS